MNGIERKCKKVEEAGLRKIEVIEYYITCRIDDH